MNTSAIQVKLTLPQELYTQIQAKSKTLGVGLATYIKHLVITDVKEMVYPVKQASKHTEAAYKSAMSRRDQAIKVDYLDEF